MSRLPLFSTVVCVAIVQQASAGSIQTPQCSKDMSLVDTSFQETLGNLQRSGRSAAVPSARCAAYKHHIEVMMKASAIFARCTTEPDRTENMNQMSGTIAEITDTLKNEKCP
jgi:hypothetical protein